MKSVDLYESTIGKEVYSPLFHYDNPTVILAYKMGEIVDIEGGERYTIRWKSGHISSVRKESCIFADEATDEMRAKSI
ncbi:hypothetical protein CL629_02220 [bacterium]|nr:hypothetical protein [bacterium]